MVGEQQLSGLRVQLARLEKQTGGPGDATANVQVPAGNVPEAGLQYVRKLRDVRYAETIFELLAKQYEAAKLDEAKTAAVIQVLDPAIEPDRKSSPQRTLIAVSASLIAFFGSAACSLLAHTFRALRRDPAVGTRWTTL